MNVDNGPCNAWPADYIWMDERWMNHRGECFCDNAWHCQVRADENTGKPVIWVTGLCPRSADAHQVQEAEAALQTFDNFDPKWQGAAHAAVRSWADGFHPKKSRNLFLFGSFGTGKTHLATAAFHAVKRRGMHAVFIRAEDLLGLFLAAMPTNAYPEEHHAAVRSLKEMETADLLVIDDLGGQTAKRESDMFISQLKSLLDDMRGCWCITTNSSAAKLEERLGESIASRLRGDVMRVEMTGNDYRSRHGLKRGA